MFTLRKTEIRNINAPATHPFPTPGYEDIPTSELDNEDTQKQGLVQDYSQRIEDGNLIE